MKRVVFVAVLLPCMMGIAIYSMVKIYYVEKAIIRMTTVVLEASSAGEKERVINEVGALVDFWEKEEVSIKRYIRHQEVDALGMTVSRLPALAKYGTEAELQSEILSVQWQVRHIKNTEVFALRNIL